MNWTNIRLIFQREFRDQLRDRRTLFTIAVLPLLLYPLLGMSFLQITQFMQEHPTPILLIGAEALPDDPALLRHAPPGRPDETESDWEDWGGVAIRPAEFASFLVGPGESRLIQLRAADRLPDHIAPDRLRGHAERLIQSGQYDVIVYFPPSFGTELQRARQSLTERASLATEDSPAADSLEATPVAVVPEPKIFVNMAQDRSRIAHDRIASILRQWRGDFVRESFLQNNIPATASEPFSVSNEDVAHEVTRRAAVWSKVLPFVVLVWALTGAFYPAIDLCAGEKERGTLETLLSSPARRSEVVWGKLLTVAAFSIVTSLLNLLSMGVTGTVIIRQIAPLADMGNFQLGPPPIASLGWLLLALVPMAALFSALSLAIAAFARSSKEAQYYLMPLLMIMLPLMMLPLLPATELNLGTSLIPVSGMMLLLRALVEGQYTEALVYTPPVLAVTAVGCMLAIRWAIDQFNNESVLFRESERWELGLWLRNLVRDRGDLPTFAEAMLCGVLLLLIRFFAQMTIAPTHDWRGIATSTLVLQIGLIATPAMLMAIVLTRRPLRALRLRTTTPLACLLAPLLAVCLHPLVMAMGHLIQQLYPMSGETLEALKPFVSQIQAAPLLGVILLIAVTPAICEELAFRGFILSGFQSTGRKWTAILLSSLFFGVTHSVLQQSLAAMLVGIVIGYVAVQSNSLFPCMLFHATHNSLGVLLSRLTPELADRFRIPHWLFHSIGEDEAGYHRPWLLVSAIASCAILLWFRGLSRRPAASPPAWQGHEPTSPVTSYELAGK